MSALVAKSYQELKQIGEVYTINGKMYIKVELKNGTAKQVRAYSNKEYEKYYGVKPEPQDDTFHKTQKEVLGFEKGYITIFKGDTYSAKEWFKEHGARYTRFWGWYIISTMEVPAELPEGIEAIQLNWDLVGTDEDVLKPDDQVQKAVDELIYDKSTSQFVGNIGDRIEKELTVVKTVQLDGYYGPSTLHTFTDEDGNVYVWTTSAKNWEEGSVHKVRGTIKDHKTYKNINQTILTRCTESKK